MFSIYYGIGYAYGLSGVLLIVYFKSLASSFVCFFSLLLLRRDSIFFIVLRVSASSLFFAFLLRIVVVIRTMGLLLLRVFASSSRFVSSSRFAFSTIVADDGENRYRKFAGLFTDHLIRKSHSFILIEKMPNI